MLYHYYMKINFTRILAAAAAVCLFSCAWAQITVVKQDGDKIYLDTSAFNRNLSVGNSFKIIVSQEKLTNPKTGRDLGLINHYSPDGKITEVQPLYAVGEIKNAAKYTIGAQAVINMDIVAAAAGAAQITNTAPATAKTFSKKIHTWPVLEKEIISAVKADLTPNTGEEIAALDTNGNLTIYADENNTLRELATYKLPAGKKPLTLSALDVRQSGQAQLFAAVFDAQGNTISTLVFDVSDGTFKKLDTLPYFVKELGCAENKKIYAQKPFAGGNKPGSAREVTYKNGHFTMQKNNQSTRGHWLTGIAFYPVQNPEETDIVFTAANGRLRMQRSNGKYTDSSALFAGAPNRVKYKQDILSFYPSLQVYGLAGHAMLAAVENTTKLGVLSENFGSYESGKIHFLTYENGRLTVQETAELDGYIYDTNCTAQGLLVPQILPGGQTVLTEIYR